MYVLSKHKPLCILRQMYIQLFTPFVVVLPGLQDERDQTACEPISLTVPVLSNCFGSAPGGVLFGVVISSGERRKKKS